MRRILLLPILFGFLCVSVYAAEMNATVKQKHDHNSSQKIDRTKKQIKEQMEREKKYAKEQTFYQGDSYDLSAAEVDKKSLSGVPILEPDYDFDMDSVYSDIQ